MKFAEALHNEILNKIIIVAHLILALIRMITNYQQAKEREKD
mgnify:CR=1 FL=1